ncbi:Rz1-like lysis system protein LysC [Serratia ficaria]|uniref:Rz1-like lysis system protein LysC n=1 Tax=Serratia ficaria TaxID=61651 RepID=UPI0021B846E7|nr:Rz1-like lysis system protein LysC [Serratia ficaria]
MTLCAACTNAPVAPPPVIVYSGCPKVTLCPMPASQPATNGDLSDDIRQLERALVSCALQVEAVKQCQEELDVKAEKPA